MQNLRAKIAWRVAAVSSSSEEVDADAVDRGTERCARPVFGRRVRRSLSGAFRPRCATPHHVHACVSVWSRVPKPNESRAHVRFAARILEGEGWKAVISQNSTTIRRNPIGLSNSTLFSFWFIYASSIHSISGLSGGGRGRGGGVAFVPASTPKRRGAVPDPHRLFHHRPRCRRMCRSSNKIATVLPNNPP